MLINTDKEKIYLYECPKCGKLLRGTEGLEGVLKCTDCNEFMKRKEVVGREVVTK